MKQVMQDLGGGATTLVDVPAPQIVNGSLLARTICSLISAGTERMLIEFGKSSLIGKARKQPDKVKMVLNKVRTDGLAATIDAVRSKLDEPIPLGYCNVGHIIEVGKGVTGQKLGDRIVSNGPHAEIVRLPAILTAKVPSNVSDEHAAFTVLASIGLQSLRLAKPTLGETFVVTGLGLIGLLTVQLLKANGCAVIGIDFDPAKLELARQFGAQTVDLSTGQDPVAFALDVTGGRGVDGVIVAATSKSDEPIHQAALMCRQRGRIVMLGVVGTNLSRADFYEKELSFQVSCSYGPGRYDAAYEEGGNDYPFGFVRWTEQRNFEAVLALMADGRLDLDPLVSSRFPIGDALSAYRQLAEDRSTLGIILTYESDKTSDDALSRTVTLGGDVPHAKASDPVCAVFGAGNFASRVLIPALKAGGAVLDTVVTSGGVRGVHFGKKYGFRATSNDGDAVMQSAGINTIVIATPHNSHAGLTISALQNGKNVFVEKPLALTMPELDKIESAYKEAALKASGAGPLLMVGFNRRFAPQIIKMKQLLDSKIQPKALILTVNAGPIPADHWVQDLDVGGGRIIGEGCHFIDLARHLIGHAITGYSARSLGGGAAVEVHDDKVTITLEFADGSIATIHYLANGGKKFPKERIEVFCGDAVLQLDNFRKMKSFGWAGFGKMNLSKQDKGHTACSLAFIEAIRTGAPAPIPVDELIEVSRVTIAIAEQLRVGAVASS